MSQLRTIQRQMRRPVLHWQQRFRSRRLREMGKGEALDTPVNIRSILDRITTPARRSYATVRALDTSDLPWATIGVIAAALGAMAGILYLFLQ